LYVLIICLLTIAKIKITHVLHLESVCLTPTMYIFISADMFYILLIVLTLDFMERK